MTEQEFTEKMIFEAIQQIEGVYLTQTWESLNKLAENGHDGARVLKEAVQIHAKDLLNGLPDCEP